MKFVIASDIHGSAFYTRKLLQIFKDEQADKLILLGDIYNHGPRNPLPQEYAPMTVAELLNSVKDNLIVVKGNCDSQVDTMISDFSFVENTLLVVGGKTVFLTHGHVYNKDCMPQTKFDAMIYGHFHTGFVEKENDVLIVNVGSVSLPKNGTQSSYVLIDGESLSLKDIDGNVLKTAQL